MRRGVTCSLILFVAFLATVGCKNRQTPTSAAKSTPAMAGQPSTAPWAQDAVTADEPLRTLPDMPDAGDPTPALTDDEGRPLEFSVAMDQTTGDIIPQTGTALGLEDSTVVFRWPSKDEVSTLKGLDKHVNLYAKQVGTCLHRTPEGDGEIEWCRGRSNRWSSVWDKRNTSFASMCREIVKQFVATTFTGSKHCQYGNCGEGGHTFMCMAAHGGYPRTHIVNCSSTNDHNFSMVWGGDTKKWCVMDRWDIINQGYFYCNANVVNGTLEYKGVKSTSKWYQDVTCTKASDKKFGS